NRMLDQVNLASYRLAAAVPYPAARADSTVVPDDAGRRTHGGESLGLSSRRGGVRHLALVRPRRNVDRIFAHLRFRGGRARAAAPWRAAAPLIKGLHHDRLTSPLHNQLATVQRSRRAVTIRLRPKTVRDRV